MKHCQTEQELRDTYTIVYKEVNDSYEVWFKAEEPLGSLKLSTFYTKLQAKEFVEECIRDTQLPIIKE